MRSWATLSKQIKKLYSIVVERQGVTSLIKQFRRLYLVRPLYEGGFIDFIRPQDGPKSSARGVLIDEGFEDGGDLLLLTAWESGSSLE